MTEILAALDLARALRRLGRARRAPMPEKFAKSSHDRLAAAASAPRPRLSLATRPRHERRRGGRSAGSRRSARSATGLGAALDATWARGRGRARSPRWTARTSPALRLGELAARSLASLDAPPRRSCCSRASSTATATRYWRALCASKQPSSSTRVWRHCPGARPAGRPAAAFRRWLLAPPACPTTQRSSRAYPEATVARGARGAGAARGARAFARAQYREPARDHAAFTRASADGALSCHRPLELADLQGGILRATGFGFSPYLLRPDRRPRGRWRAGRRPGREVTNAEPWTRQAGARQNVALTARGLEASASDPGPRHFPAEFRHGMAAPRRPPRRRPGTGRTSLGDGAAGGATSTSS